MTGSVLVRAPAKVNLFLRVLSRREDGFHQLETLFQAIDLCDVVRVRWAREGVRLDVEGPDPCPPEENLAFRAALGFLSLFPSERGVQVTLEKRIPAGAGLGGGSSDAAAVLRCLLALSGVASTPPELMRMAAELGADVPFFLGESALARGTGRGELLEPLRPLPARWVVLSLPPVHVSTGAAYESLSRRTARSQTPSGAGVQARSWDDVVLQLSNDFQDVVSAQHASVAESLAALQREGASGVLLSGSGAASFGVFGSRAEAREVAGRLCGEFGWPFRAAETLTALPELQPMPASEL